MSHFFQASEFYLIYDNEMYRTYITSISINIFVMNWGKHGFSLWVSLTINPNENEVKHEK